MEVHAALAPDNAEAADSIKRSGIAVHILDLSRNSVNPFRILREAAGLRRIMRRVRPDIVNPINLKSVLVSALAGIGLGHAFVGVITGLGHLFVGDAPGKRVPRWLTMQGLKWGLPRGRHVLVFSNADDRDEFLKRGITAGDRTEIIPVPGIDPGEFAPSPEPESGFRVVLPARMLWDKGVGEFVRAAETLRGRIPGGEFLLAGGVDSGNPSAIREERLREWERMGLVTWLGRRDDMPALLASCHVVCLPSFYREGFPRVLAEGMACGRAIVTADTPGCRDAVTESGGGLLVAPRSGRELAEAIAYLHDNPDERRAMGRRGRTWVERELDCGIITGRMSAVYDGFPERSSS